MRLAASTLVAMVGACSSVASDRLAVAAPPTPGQGDVYLLRTRSDVSADKAFAVMVDDRPVGSLVNGSYLWLRLHPGHHVLKVNPGFAKHAAELTMKVEPGQVGFVHYDFPTGVMANPFFLGAALRERSTDDGRDMIVGLQASRGESGEPCVDVPITAGNLIPLDDAEAVPHLDAKGRAGYRDWLRKPAPRAFVVTADGDWHSSWGLKSAERAIRQCQDSGRSDCRLYAVDNRVVWDQRQ